LNPGLPDYDWYAWQMAQAGTFTGAVTTDAASGQVELRLFTLVANAIPGGLPTLKLLQKTVSNGGATQLVVSAPVLTGQEILLEVKGANTSTGVHDTA